MAANASSHLTTAATHAVITEGASPNQVLHRVIVNTGAAGATISLQYADDSEVIGVIDAENRDIGVPFDLDLDGRGLDVVIAGGTPDVTVLHSG